MQSTLSLIALPSQSENHPAHTKKDTYKTALV